MPDIFSAASTLTGVGMGILGTALHSGLKVPAYQPIDLTASQGQSIAGNLQNAPAAENLASRTTAFNQQELLNMLRSAIPNYDALQSKTGQNIASMLSGEIPADVSAQIRRQTAAKALGGGYGGSGMSRNLTTRDLGLTSLQLTQTGLDAASRWIAQTSQEMQPAFMSSSSMFFTPQQRVQLDIAQREMTWKQQVMQANADYDQSNLWSNFLSTQGAMLQGFGMSGGGAGMFGNAGGRGGGYTMAGMDQFGSPVFG